MINAALARIILRYGAAALVTYGVIKIDFSADPDVMMLAEIIVGALLGAIAEGWYALARKWGWET